MPLLEPDRYFSRLSHVDIERDLLALGFRFVLLDIDNTILTRDTHEVPRDAGFWLAKARDAGITFCLVSNNWHEGVYQLANRLSLPIVAKAVKPLPPAFLEGLGQDRRNARCHGRHWRPAGHRRTGRPLPGHEGLSAGPARGAGPAPHAAAAQLRAPGHGRAEARGRWRSDGLPAAGSCRRCGFPQHPISRRCRRLAYRSIPQGDFLRGAFRLRHPHDLGRRGNPR